jgi:glycosyltransferase involved in cell wall biosynthesis
VAGPLVEQPSDVPRGGPWPILVPRPSAPPTPSAAPPTFSVVIAAYQAEGSVAAAVESALQQTLAPLEVVVCDDGSTDATPAVLSGFGDAIRVVRRPNGGESAAKNTAVAAARGQFVVVLDADDVFHRRRLEALAWLAQQRPDLDVLTTDAVLEADGVPVRRAYTRSWPFPTEDQRAAILDRNFVFGLCAVRRERWLEAGGFDEDLRLTADWEFWQRLVLGGSGVGLVAEPLARYRLTAGTLSSSRSRLVQARLDVLARAAARPDLSPDERRVLDHARRRERRELRRRLATEGLERGGWHARKRAAAVLLAPDETARARLGALVAVLSPAGARRRRLRRYGDTIEVGAGVRVARPRPGAPGNAAPGAGSS